MATNDHIRNFSIIAHIDHGKSTLADRLLQHTHSVSKREFRDQLLDDMDLERERGITIKARAVTIMHELDGETYQLNLIDTPGHVDFSYEVSRSLKACEGALLLVDAAQGVEAQTVANTYLALEQDLAIIPVLNKIDLGHARTEESVEELVHLLGVEPEEIIRTSAKDGIGVDEVLEAIVRQVPPPEADADADLRALIFDCVFDDYRGVVIYVRVMDGEVRVGDRMRLLSTGDVFDVDELGHFRPERQPCDMLQAGDVGYCMANIRTMDKVAIGDTVTLSHCRDVEPLPGFKQPQPMVFCGLFPTNATDFHSLRGALERLILNDSSFTFQPETSDALGYGFRCGFLGMLHMEIVQERLERESNVDLVQTAPNVTYEILTRKGETVHIDNPSKMPSLGEIEEIREPMVAVSLLLPADSVGPIMRLVEDRRGIFKRTEYLSQTRVTLTVELPLAEIVFDFYDKLKSATRGYGTMDYEFIGYAASKLVRLDVLVAGERVDAMSVVVHRSKAEDRGRRLVKRLKEEIPRHMFPVALQAAIGSKVIARETIPAMAKHVTAKCYGGDITRKRKLWAKQREGKKRMKQVGRVEISQQAFLSVLATD